MIDFRLTEEQEALRESVRDFAREQIAPVIATFYDNHSFPYDLVRQMGKMGLFGLPFPEADGGMGGDYFTLCVALEEIARVDSSVAATLEAGVSLGAMPIFRFGTPAQKAQWLPKLLSGEALAGFGLTEPGAGSDAGGTQTRARLDEVTGEWVINGSKAFITNSGTDITSLVTVTARTGPDEISTIIAFVAAVMAVTGVNPDGSKELSTIIVPSGTPGFTVAPGYSKVGWCASDTHELAFDDVRVPAANLLGARGRGFAQFLRILDEGRIAIAALSVGLAQGCVDESVAYAKQREAFGRPIGDNQSIQFMIADMEMRVHTARLAYYDAAARMLQGADFKRYAAVAKLTASNAAMENSRSATQVHGGYGFMNESAVGRFYRDAKILEIGEGTSEVQRMLISRSLGL